jgi:TonB family protein
MLSALALSLALSWVQIKSETFVVKSSAGEDRAKRVLTELEAFHQLVGTAVVFQKVRLPELPIEVLIVGDEKQFAELAPEYQGKKLKIAGYYERGQDRDFIVLSGNIGGNLTHIVYHELTHYFLSRSLQSRSTWLSEGLAEYFSTADIDGDTVYLGGLSPERLQLLKTDRLLPLKEFFAVDDRSPYYNETAKANVFYAQAGAFVHFLTHGVYQDAFRRYLEDLTVRDVEFSDYIKTDVRTLEFEFEGYVKTRMRSVMRQKVKTSSDGWTMTRQPITDADAELSIAEIFLSGHRLNEARVHLEKAAGIDDEFPRASYYRGVLARITNEGDPREFFIDALMDLNLGPRAAVHLVQLRELTIPAVRRALEKAAASNTHMADVYWALTEIYLDDARRIEETMRLTRNAATPQIAAPPLPNPPAADPVFLRYGQGSGDHFKFELLSETGSGPAVETMVTPFYPPELMAERLSGRVVLDVQISEGGEVGGVWLISSTPEIFSGLATAAVRDWKFQPIPSKIRVVLEFSPAK